MEQDNKDFTYEDIKPGVHFFRTEEISRSETESFTGNIEGII